MIGDELLDTRDNIHDRDLMMSILNGVGREFDPIIVLISSHLDDVSPEHA